MIKVKAKDNKVFAKDKELKAGQKLTMMFEDLKGKAIIRKATYKGFNKKLKLFIIEKESSIDPGKMIDLKFRAEGINSQKIYVEEEK